MCMEPKICRVHSCGFIRVLVHLQHSCSSFVLFSYCHILCKVFKRLLKQTNIQAESLYHSAFVLLMLDTDILVSCL
jgi:hypothetical protein